MFFVSDPRGCCAWWSEHLGDGAVVRVEEGGFCWFETGGLEVGFHPGDDERNPVGGSPVVYFSTQALEATRARLLDAGCLAHRGPLAVGPGRRICQLIDPFGNTFGLTGP